MSKKATKASDDNGQSMALTPIFFSRRYRTERSLFHGRAVVQVTKELSALSKKAAKTILEYTRMCVAASVLPIISCMVAEI